MLNKIKFVKDYRCFKTNDEFEFKQLNLIVGDNGCGKSSLIRAIVNHSNDKSNSAIDIDMPNQMSFIFFDFEKMNPRTKESLTSVADNQDVYNFSLLSHFKSHGETNNTILGHLKTIENTLVVMDEPDMALSISSIKGLTNTIIEGCERGNQFVLSCHNPLLIEMIGNVYSLEDRQWLNAEDFIKKQLEKQ